MKILLLHIVFFLNITFAFTQKFSSKDERMLKDLIKISFDKVFSDFDSTSIHEYYTKDFILLENGELWNNDTIINYQNRSKLNSTKYKRENFIDVIETKISKDMAWIAYKNTAIFTAENKEPGKMIWLESATAIRTNKGWKLQMMHSTPVKRN
jgi:hypothetical protein